MSLHAQVLKMRADGVGPREIARRLSVSSGVVSGILHRAKAAPGARATDSFLELAVAGIGDGSIYAAAKTLRIPESTLRGWARGRARAFAAQARTI